MFFFIFLPFLSMCQTTSSIKAFETSPSCITEKIHLIGRHLHWVESNSLPATGMKIARKYQTSQPWLKKKKREKLKVINFLWGVDWLTLSRDKKVIPFPLIFRATFSPISLPWMTTKPFEYLKTNAPKYRKVWEYFSSFAWIFIRT